MIYVIEFIIAFIGGFIVGLINKNLVKGVINGSMILPKHRHSLYSAGDYEKLGGFRSKFLGIFMLLASIAIVGILLYDLILLKPFIDNFGDPAFYLKLLGFIVGIYYGVKIISGTIRQQMDIKDEGLK
ncbi:MAG: hypothetical protein HY918_01325 [Candidatus Doudnabacteria bacterium]|nr:hypothetical protein [Candidatus Doudnabacteria bacterium]